MTVALPPVVDGALIEAKLRCLLKFIGLETLQAPVTQLKSSPVEAQTTERITFTPGLPVPSRTFEIVKQGGDRPEVADAVTSPPDGYLTIFDAHHAPAEADPLEAGHQTRHLIDSELSDNGILLIRDTGLSNAESCSRFAQGLGYDRMTYEPYGPPRKKIAGMDSVTAVPGQFRQDIHNEMSYNPEPNSKIIFMCLQPAESGGENLLAKTADFTSQISAATLQRFNNKGGVRYLRVYNDPYHGTNIMSWGERTGCDTLQSAAQYWRDLGFQPADITSRRDGKLFVENRRPACIHHPESGDPLFFNIAQTRVKPVNSTPFQITYGDGDEIEDCIIAEIIQAHWNATVALRLEQGDMLVLDNYAALHGRLPYTGEDRTLLTLLTRD